MALIMLFDDLWREQDGDSVSIFVLLDLSVAFDDHDSLLDQL